ncbi:hypothetical protein WR25_15867 isoform F [Diploscapter pachys]|uniref:Protein RFT1 homolog n=1 Tax=Diploscapter pachys TaxID=2018661 RepID=A0A2A2LM66_9BILA|nr:hypothetical protein WR25_15867 isoform F [Diploscapter pachys]
MSSSLATSIATNFSAQLVARVCSFLITAYLLRIVDNDVLGLVNVRLTLLYSTILFLTREPMRKADILKDSLPAFVNLIWCSPLICGVLSVLCTLLWRLTLSSSVEVPFFTLASFPLAAFIESCAEPFAVIALRFSLHRQFAIAQAILISFQRITVFLWIVLFHPAKENELFVFAVAQILASFFYLTYYFVTFYRLSKQKTEELKMFGGFADFFPKFGFGIDVTSVRAVTTLMGHSIFKQLLTDGSSYVMTFTQLLSLKQQAVYDSVERLGSLVARIALAPIEELASAYFSSVLQSSSKVFKNNTKSFDDAVSVLSNILYVMNLSGLIVCAFGLSYAKIAVTLYGGNLLADNGGGRLLSVYAIYLWTIALNGITECFAMASMTNKGVSLELNYYMSNHSIVVSIPDSLARRVHGPFRLDPPDSQLHSLQLFRPCRFHLRQHHQHARQNHLQLEAHFCLFGRQDSECVRGPVAFPFYGHLHCIRIICLSAFRIVICVDPRLVVYPVARGHWRSALSPPRGSHLHKRPGHFCANQQHSKAASRLSHHYFFFFFYITRTKIRYQKIDVIVKMHSNAILNAKSNFMNT